MTSILKKPIIATIAATILVASLFTFIPIPEAATDDDDVQLISESEILSGLAADAIYPFIDSTPNKIKRVHIAITDATLDCSAGAEPPMSIQVLVGQAGGILESVMDATTNTGIGSVDRCVFHVTVKPSNIGTQITDIVVVNGGTEPLTGINTVTVTAEVRT